MGRLITGATPTPAKVRQASYRAALQKAGGRRVIADLEPAAAAALAACEASGMTMKDAIAQALIAYAPKRR